MPADGNRAADGRMTGDFGTSPIFVQLSDKPLLASAHSCGVPERKAQCQRREITEATPGALSRVRATSSFS